jgi:5'-3' exonuclease
MDRVLLIDGHNAMWRASVGFGPPRLHSLCDHSQPSFFDIKHPSADVMHCVCGANWDPSDNKCYGEKYVFIYNFFRNLRPQIEDVAPDKCFFVLEGHPQFRYDLFADYKANRLVKQAAKQDTMDKFHAAKNEIVRLLQYLPITIARAADYEADDVIATLCDNMKEEDLTVISNDSDYIQLLQRGYKHLTIYNPIKKVAMEAPAYPYVAWKCLNGDKSDNIPALLKPKKALDTVNNPDLFRKFMEVEENRANFNINRQLIEFRPIPEEEIILQEGRRNFTNLKLEFARMDFQSIINPKSWEKYITTFDCLRY